MKDFTPVARAGSYVFMLVVNPDIPAKTLPELVAYAKANPGKLTYASGNTTGIVAGETLKSEAGIDVLHIPYKSTPPALNDVLGGRVSMMFIDLAPGLEHVRAGTLRALAVTTKERSALLPDLPSLHEAGIPGYDVTSWAGLFAPAGTPKEIVARLNDEVAQDHRQPGGEGAHRGDRVRCVQRAAGNARRVRAVRARQLGQADQGRRHRAAVSSRYCPAFSPAPISRVPSASANRVCAEPGRSDGR